MKDSEKILFNLGQMHADFLAQEVIEQLISLTGKEFLLSGDDSGLKNVWEEICVQVQQEYSYYWDTYEITIEEHIIALFEAQGEFIQQAIGYWAQQSDEMRDEEEDEEYFDLDQCVREIKGIILSDAEDYSNNRIEKYLNEDEDEDEDWDEDEEEYEEDEDEDWDEDEPEEDEDEDNEDS